MHQQCTIEQRDTSVFLANEQKTKWVTIITLVTMVIEVSVGYWSGSMALLADGWHMASHALALTLSLIVYYLYRHPKFRSSFTFGGGKILSLGGYTSSIFLVLIALSMIVESIHHLREDRVIQYNEALIVAVVGLVINLICALILHQGENHAHAHDHDVGKLQFERVEVKNHQCNHDHGHHHDHGHVHFHDHNHHSAYVHVLTDALTSVMAIAALLLGMWLGWSWLDPAVGIVGGVVVLKWAVELIRQSGMDLLDAHVGSIDRAEMTKTLEMDGSRVLDMHLWKIAPGQIGCEIIIQRNSEKSSAEYRDLIQKNFQIQHLIIEVVKD
jgi:cation diffusion facilitator family transporter